MPGPVVYVVAAVGVVAVGIALKELLFDPYVAPHLEQWRDEHRARREAKRRRRHPVAPHFTHEADSTHQPASTHELRDLGLSATDRSSTLGTASSSAGLRNRRRNVDVPSAGDSAAPGLMDVPNENNIPFAPLAPESNPWSTASTSRSLTLSPSQSPFELGSESATLPSASPRSHDFSLSVSRASSPISMSPRIQLPTPSESDVMTPSSPETHPDLLESTSISPLMSPRIQLPTPSTSDAPLPQTLSPEPHPDLFAPSMSRTFTDTSASFITAQSPTDDFRSFPPSAPTSPFSESFALSGDEDMYSFGSQSSESLLAFATEEGHNTSHTYVIGNTAERDGLDDLSYSSSASSGDGSSDGGWVHDFNGPRSGATSPRH